MTEAVETEIPTPTREQAIEYVIGRLVASAIAEGQEAAQVLGAEIGSEIVLQTVKLDRLALEALGVSLAEVQAIAEDRAQELDLLA